MRPMRVIGIAMLLLLAACGGDGETDVGDESNTPRQTQSDTVVGGDPEFSLSDLPDDFPSELLPPDYLSGAYLDLGVPTASFEVAMSFDEAVDRYNGLLGEGLVLGNDPGERLAQWTDSPPWIVSVLEGEPVIVGISKVPDE